MNVDFTAEQNALRDTVRSFLDEQWPSSQIRAGMAGPGLTDVLWSGVVDLGLTTLLVPEAHGGLGLSLADVSLIFETFGETLAPGLIGETILASDVIARFGTPEQREALLPAVAEGRMKLSTAIQESATGYDPTEIAAVATASGNGWRLTGTKRMVPYAHLADRILVAARVGDTGAVALFLCDPHLPGVEPTPHVLIDPTYRMSMLRFDGVDLPGEALLGGAKGGGALGHAMRTAAASTSAQLTGIAGRALGMTLDYVKQRRQFGRAIGSFQAIKHKLADMMVTYETARSAIYYAHWAIAEADLGAGAAVALAKAYASDMSRAVLNESVHIHGGIGFTFDYDLHLFLKRGKLFEYAAGDATWHREQYARAVIDGAPACS
jgi:acyl-CoA dehydrogenase